MKLVAYRCADVHILGATLWTDYALRGLPFQTIDMHAACSDIGMNDHKFVRIAKHAYRRWRPADALAEHVASCTWLKQRLSAGRLPGERVVVVTHHAPSAKSIPPHATGDPFSPCYASKLDELAAISHFTNSRRAPG